MMEILLDQYRYLQLPTYPSPNLTTVNWQQLKVDVGLGEG